MNKKILSLMCIAIIVLTMIIGLVACNKSYTITYILPLDEGGSLTETNVYAEKQQAKGSEIEFPDTPVKESTYGYEFGGWYDNDGNLIEEKSIKVNSDMTLYGRWVKISYKITYDFQGGGSLKPNEKNPDSYTMIDGVSSFYEPVSNRKGYEFLGWYDKDGVLWESVKRGTKNDLNLFARWGEIEYPIEYRGLQNGINSQNNPSYYTITDEIVLEKASRKGYEFLGWYDKATGGNKIEKIEKGSTEKLTLYAQWKAIDYAVSFDLNGGRFEEGTIVPDSYTAEDGLPLPTPLKEGYKFAGWLDEASGAVYFSIPPRDITGDKHFVAQWQIEEYELRYIEVIYDKENNIEQSIGGTNTVKFTKDDTVTISDVFTLEEREGYTFLGWYEGIEKTSPEISQIQKGTTQSVVVYAIWQKN